MLANSGTLPVTGMTRSNPCANGTRIQAGHRNFAVTNFYLQTQETPAVNTLLGALPYPWSLHTCVPQVIPTAHGSTHTVLA
jgi:hypothetical protein